MFEATRPARQPAELDHTSQRRNKVAQAQTTGKGRAARRARR
jgi:hypothetical protein